jgi:predicted type IV restriction endonuclease
MTWASGWDFEICREEEGALAILDDLRTAATQAVTAGVNAAKGQGAALRADFETLVKPRLDAVVIQIAAITDDVVAGIIGAEQAREDLKTQLDNIEPLILAVSELALLAVQVIINAIMDALKAAVNTATTRGIGIALL